MDNQTAKSIDRSLKSIAKSLEKMTREKPPMQTEIVVNSSVRSEEDVEKIASQIVSRFVEAGKAGE